MNPFNYDRVCPSCQSELVTVKFLDWGTTLAKCQQDGTFFFDVADERFVYPLVSVSHEIVNRLLRLSDEQIGKVLTGLFPESDKPISDYFLKTLASFEEN